MGLLVPVVARVPALAEMTIHHLRKVTADMAWCRSHGVNWRFHLLVNGESCYDEKWYFDRLRSAGALEKINRENGELNQPAPNLPKCYLRRCQMSMDTHCRMLSVSECWNEGVTTAFSEGCRLLIIMANDVIPEPECLQNLVEFMATNKDVDIASGAAVNLNDVPVGDDRVSDGCDFSCFILKRKTIEKFGYFDPNYRVAYFEDNDYMARIWRAGGIGKVVHQARFHHVKSQTIARDPDQAAHVRAWFEKNRSYFVRKWGREPVGTPAEAVAGYYPTPFNDAGKAISWNPPLES